MKRVGVTAVTAVTAALMAVADGPWAMAQVQLPGVVVTSPSPVQRPAPQPRPAAPATAPGPPRPAAGTTAEPTPAPVPGSLVVVDDAFTPVTVVTGREVTATPGATITDALSSRPGITGSTFAPGANRPVIRGLDAHRVRIQENGIGTADVSAISPDHAIPIDPFAAERIEVIHGPGSLRYGSQGIGGVVSVENNRIPGTMPANGVSAEIKGGLNSADMGRDGGMQITAGSGRIVVHADTFTRRTFDYDTPQGKQINSFVDSQGYSLGASYVVPEGFVGLSFTRFSSLYGVAGAEALTARPRIDLAQEKLQSRGEWRIRDYGIEAIRYWLGSTRYAHNEVVIDDVAAQDIVGTRFTSRELEGRTEVQHLPVHTALGVLRGAAGIQAGHRKVAGFSVDEPGDGLLDPAARQRFAAVFLFEELEVAKKLRLQAATRLEVNKAVGTAIEDAAVPTAPERFERTFRPTSGSFGVLYELPLGVVARLTGQITERAPDAGELFSKGPHEATETFEIGNPSLTIEQARTLELGFKKAKGDLRFDASLYRTRYAGFIFKNFTGLVCDETVASCGGGTELDQTVYGQRDATFTGAELAAQLDVQRIWRGVWGIDGQYDFVRAQFDGGIGVPRIPPHRAGAGIYYRDPAWFARINMLHAFRQDEVSAIDPKDTPTSGYTLLNAEVAYTWKSERFDSLTPEWTIGLKAENLLDDDVRNHVSPKKDEVLQPGRTFRLFGSVKLN